MALTKTTRELILSKIDELKDKVSLLQQLINSCSEKGSTQSDFVEFNEIEIDLFKGQIQAFKDALINDSHPFNN